MTEELSFVKVTEEHIETLFFAVDYLKKLYTDEIILWVLEENHKACHFYEHLGFMKTEETRIIDRGRSLNQLKYRLS